MLSGNLVIGNSNKYVIANNAKFMVPDGYQITDGNYSVSLKKGNETLSITKNTTSKDIDKQIKEYMDYKESSNHTTKLSNFTVDGITVYKVTIDGSEITHYWFEKNNNVYEMYTKNGSQNTDNLVKNLIENME